MKENLLTAESMSTVWSIDVIDHFSPCPEVEEFDISNSQAIRRDRSI